MFGLLKRERGLFGVIRGAVGLLIFEPDKGEKCVEVEFAASCRRAAGIRWGAPSWQTVRECLFPRDF